MSSENHCMYSCKKCHRSTFTKLDEEIPFCNHCNIKKEKVGE